MNPAPLIPITFTREIERIEHRHPYFFKQVPGQVVYAPETTTEIIEEQQVRFARRFIKRVEGDVPARIWNGEDLNRKRVAYLGDGMLGDALIHTAVWRELKYRYPTMDLHAFVSSGHPACDMVARFNRDIGHVARRHHMTLTREQLESFDYWLTPRNVGYLYRGSDERTQYELLEEDLGIEITHKRPYVFAPPEAFREIAALFGDGVPDWNAASSLAESKGNEGGMQGRNVSLINPLQSAPPILVQVAASEEARTPPVELIVSIIKRLRDLHPTVPIFVVGERKHVFPVLREVPPIQYGAFPLAVDLAADPGTPYVTANGILQIVRRAGLIVAPDSFLMHASATWDVPCVALWQDDPTVIAEARIPSPQSRIKHYGRVRASGFKEGLDGFSVAYREVA